MSLDPAYAQQWAETIARVLATAFPWASAHVSTGPDDCDVTPWVLHPCFHGSFDWHSSCHMQLSAIVLLDRAELAEPTRQALLDQLDARLTLDNARVEADYLAAHPRYERPYGWAWVAQLAAVARASTQPQAAQWAAAVELIADQVAENLLAFLPKMAYPIRGGQHDNTAFGLALLRDAYAALERFDVVAAIDARARDWYASDRAYPISFEPSGNDFLSPGLCEADLMRRVLGEEFGPWLAQFLPGLAAEGDPLLELPVIHDRTDGKLAHLLGLTLSRAAQLRALAPHLDEAAAAQIAERTPALIAEIEQEISEGDFMATHWLVTFALWATGEI